MARPKGVTARALTLHNTQALRACRDQGLLPDTLMITPTTASWPVSYNAAGALQTVLAAIQATDGTTRRSLHAVRRKLEKQTRPGEKPTLATPNPPRASKRLLPSACDHAQREGVHGLTELRAKCLCCGLTYDRPAAADRPPRRKLRATPAERDALHASQRPMKPGQGGVTSAQVVPAASPAPKPQTAPQARYVALRHEGSWLIADLVSSNVVASNVAGAIKDAVVAALNATTAG